MLQIIQTHACRCRQDLLGMKEDSVKASNAATADVDRLNQNTRNVDGGNNGQVGCEWHCYVRECTAPLQHDNIPGKLHTEHAFEHLSCVSCSQQVAPQPAAGASLLAPQLIQQSLTGWTGHRVSSAACIYRGRPARCCSHTRQRLCMGASRKRCRPT